MSIHRGAIGGVVSALILSLGACTDPAAEPIASDPPVISAQPQPAVTVGFPVYSERSDEVAEGARLFAYQRCAECHSDAGVILGAGYGNVDRIATAIRDGRGDGMPAYGGRLTDAQIWQVAAFVKALDERSDRETIGRGVDLTSGN